MAEITTDNLISLFDNSPQALSDFATFENKPLDCTIEQLATSMGNNYMTFGSYGFIEDWTFQSRAIPFWELYIGGLIKPCPKWLRPLLIAEKVRRMK